MKLPTTQQIAAILEFLPVLKRSDFNAGTMHGFRRGENGVMFPPWMDYSEEALRLISALNDNGFVEAFDWMSWQETASQYVDDRSLVGKADLDTIKRLLTTHVRYDHFCDGHFAAMIESGHLTAILERLAELQRHTLKK